MLKKLLHKSLGLPSASPLQNGLQLTYTPSNFFAKQKEASKLYDETTEESELEETNQSELLDKFGQYVPTMSEEKIKNMYGDADFDTCIKPAFEKYQELGFLPH